MPRLARRRIALAGVFLCLLISGSAYAALQQLPPGDQVNNDPAAGIDPTQPVNLDDPTNADVVGGALTPGAKNVPWSVFRQTESSAHDQVFSRSFANGAWTTRGHGTVGGLSSASPTFSGSLNFDQNQDGEAPAIDFAGSGRAVPWATWYEDTTAFGGAKNIFASRFDANQDKWVFAGQGRGTGGGPVEVPSLNIHTNQDAENPSVAGGSLVDPTKPGPWITWQEVNGGNGKDQIFVVRPIGPGATNCTGVKPVADDPNAAPAGGFCWQQVGVQRLTGDPTLNVDRTRAGVEPDIAFTGKNDSVPWVVWYEQDDSGVPGLHGNEMVFAAKGVAPGTPTGTVDGNLNFVAVGNTGQGILDNSGTNGGPCAENAAAEAGCSLNADPSADAEDPRVAAGTMTPGTPTSPWVVWDEGDKNNPANNKVFASRLVNGQFKIANGGQPIGTGDRPDITFSANTPYVTWHNGGKVVTGHFVTPDQFVKDNTPIGTNASDEVRAPISSDCTANPFTQDGSACPGGATGTPFFLFSDGDASHAKLFADSIVPDALPGGGQTPPATSDHTAPHLKLKALKIRLGALLRSGKLKVKVSVNEPSRVGLTASIKTNVARKRTLTIGRSHSVTFRSKGTKTVTITLTKKGKAALRHVRKAKLTISARATDLAGNTRVSRVTTTVKR